MTHDKTRDPITLAEFLTAYAEGDAPVPAPDESAPEAPAPEAETGEGDTTIVIPEDLTTLEDEELAGIHSSAVEAFNALYSDDITITDEVLTALSSLTDGIEKVQAEIDERAKAMAARREKAQSLASKAGVEPTAPAAPAEPEAVVEAPEAVTAAASKEIRLNLTGLRARRNGTLPPKAPVEEQESTGPKWQSMKDIVKASPEFSGYTAGDGLTWSEIGRGLDKRLASFNKTPFEAANAKGRHLRQQLGMLSIHKPFEEGMVLKSNDAVHIDQILQNAMKETRLPGNSLVAAGGWCAPSETVYDLCELESRDGLLSLPEIGITRGGINFTQGPNWADIFANTGFCYTEEEDIAGDYDGAGGGSKPCYTVECPDFTDERLDYCGVCINAGLLMQRGYPEVIARTVRGALVAHDHRMSAQLLNAMAAQSTQITMPADQVGATAPILTAIELQVEHFRNVNRLARATSLEAIFPYWVRGAIRSDLSRRLGVDLLSVSDGQINTWFTDRGISPQFVYNWNDISTTAASGFTAWPTEVDFLLYAAGTFVKGGADIITIDTLYDSVLLGTNDFTALFTEEGWLLAKMCHDSRLVTVNICPDGATHAGVDIGCDGSTP
jgi:hypothetical protein